jgi:integrase
MLLEISLLADAIDSRYSAMVLAAADDLRHTHASLLIAQGEHPKVIQERLGHASIKTTLDIYGHLFDGLDEAAADRLEETLAAADVHAMCTREDAPVIALADD